MKRITSLVPRKTEVILGNRIFLVGEMRLSDLASLQEWLESQWENPLEAARESLLGLKGRDRQKVLSTIWDACETGPPEWGTDRAQKLLNTAEGIAQMFVTILSEHSMEKVGGKWVHQDFTRGDILDVAEATGENPEGWNQYMSMIRAWQPVDPIEEVSFQLGMDSGPQGKPVTWVQAVCQACESYGWSIEYVMGLTMRQFKAIRTGGKPKVYGTAVQPKTNLKLVVAEMKRKNALKGKG